MQYKLEKLFYLLMAFILLNVFFLMSPNNHKVIADFQTDISARVARAFTQTIGTDPWGREVGHIYTYTYNFYTQAADSYIALVSLPDIDKQMADIATQTFDIFKYVVAQEKPKVDEYVAVGLPKEIFMQIPPLENIIPMNHVARIMNQEVRSNPEAERVRYGAGKEKESVIASGSEAIYSNDKIAAPLASLEARNDIVSPPYTPNSKFQIPNSTPGSILGVYTDPWVNIQDPISGKFYCVAIYGGEVNKYEGKCVKEYY